MFQQTPFFSIVVPTYSRPAQLMELLKSLACLEYPRDRFEVIVVDDGGTGRLEEIAAPQAGSLDLVLLPQSHKGASQARNNGAAHSKGDYIVFTDDDCLPDPNWLNAFAATSFENRDCVLGGKTINAFPLNRYSSASQFVIDVVYDYYNSDAGHATFFASNNIALPARQFHEVGGFDKDFSTSEDRDLCDRLLQSGFRLVFVPTAVVRHAKQLTLQSFWSQYFAYGRGAFRYHRARRRRDSGNLKPDRGFYAAVLCALARHRARFSLAMLLIIWQIANAAGFAREWFDETCGAPDNR